MLVYINVYIYNVRECQSENFDILVVIKAKEKPMDTKNLGENEKCYVSTHNLFVMFFFILLFDRKRGNKNDCL